MAITPPSKTSGESFSPRRSAHTEHGTVFITQHPAAVRKIIHVGTPTRDRFATGLSIEAFGDVAMLTVPASPWVASEPKDPGEAIPQHRQGWQALSMTEPHSDQTTSNTNESDPNQGLTSGQLGLDDALIVGSEPLGPGDVKQVIVIRRDLHMRRGKEIAQGSHASSAWISFAVADALRRGETTLDLSIISEAAKVWLTSSFRKVTLQVQTEADIVALHEKAVAAGLESQLITDSGKTEFGGNPTITALAIGPNRAIDIDAITGHLGIY